MIFEKEEGRSERIIGLALQNGWSFEIVEEHSMNGYRLRQPRCHTTVTGAMILIHGYSPTGIRDGEEGNALVRLMYYLPQ